MFDVWDLLENVSHIQFDGGHLDRLHMVLTGPYFLTAGFRKAEKHPEFHETSWSPGDFFCFFLFGDTPDPFYHQLAVELVDWSSSLSDTCFSY